jgi:polyphosphate kinase
MNTEGLSNSELQDAQPVVDEAVAVEAPPVESVAPVPAPAPAAPAPAVIPNLDDSSLYIHRELSQLKFNIRVLEQALDESYPLLERLKFLLIFSSILDEFFEIRVAGLKKQINFARDQAGPDGLQPHQSWARVAELSHEQV